MWVDGQNKRWSLVNYSWIFPFRTHQPPQSRLGLLPCTVFRRPGRPRWHSRRKRTHSTWNRFFIYCPIWNRYKISETKNVHYVIKIIVFCIFGGKSAITLSFGASLSWEQLLGKDKKTQFFHVSSYFLSFVFVKHHSVSWIVRLLFSCRICLLLPCHTMRTTIFSFKYKKVPAISWQFRLSWAPSKYKALQQIITCVNTDIFYVEICLESLIWVEWKMHKKTKYWWNAQKRQQILIGRAYVSLGAGSRLSKASWQWTLEILQKFT